jgi:hypothetical protein
MSLAQDHRLRLRHGPVRPTLLEELRSVIGEAQPSLVILDTLIRLPRPQLEMADYFAISSWLDPYIHLAHESGVAFLALYHSTKAGRGVEGADAITTILGSTALGAAIDQLLYLTQTKSGTRAFGSVGRFTPIPPTLLSFDPKTQRMGVIGEKSEVRARDQREAVLEALGGDDWVDRNTL